MSARWPTAREGAHVALLDVNLDAAVQTCTELVTEGMVVECDVGSAASVKAAMGAVFLLSDKARFITGCALPVSGGAELGYRR